MAETLSQVETYQNFIDGDWCDGDGGANADRLQSLQVKLAMLRGPVREHARAVFRGEADSTRIHVSVSGEAVALAAIVATLAPAPAGASPRGHSRGLPRPPTRPLGTSPPAMPRIVLPAQLAGP